MAPTVDVMIPDIPTLYVLIISTYLTAQPTDHGQMAAVGVYHKIEDCTAAQDRALALSRAPNNVVIESPGRPMLAGCAVVGAWTTWK